MKERGLIRIIILLSGALLWVAYLFDTVCSRYAIYEVIGYGAHELLSKLPYVSALTTAVWLAITLVKGARGKTLCPQLAWELLQPGTEYLVTYEWDDRMPQEGTLCMVHP